MPKKRPALGSFIRRLFVKTDTSQIQRIACRFIDAFRDHGVDITQIPRLIPLIRLGDLESPQKLITVLTPEILDQVATLFGIRVQWLEGIDDQIYEYLACYKRPEAILEHLAALLTNENVRHSFPLRILCTTRQLDCNSDARQQLAPVLIENISELGEETIYRYHIYRDGFDWSYEPGRIELKAIARILFRRLGAPAPLYVVGEKEMDSILEGRLVPRRYLNSCPVTNPSLEDYALTQKESAAAKEVQELPVVLRYIEEHSLSDFSFARNQIPAASVDCLKDSVPRCHISQIADPKLPGKRAQAQADTWGPARNAAQAIWAQDKQLSIADLVARIKTMSFLKASKLSESAIRKRIADLAPEGIAGKPGRKPNKLS